MRPLLPLLLLVACPAADEGPPLTDTVDLVLWTAQCEPELDPEDHFYIADNGEPWHIAWELPCVRDGGEVTWFAVKVSLWEDRAEDLWNLWYVDPSIHELRYGQASVDGALDPQNTAYPDALLRVGPISPLDVGDYRVEVWAVVNDSLDAQRNEVRLTVVE